ncbi:MAG: hypothetical protein IJ347_02780 [Faecalibacterium sp.]|nr:hypothetical protein [Faecalibacterium sp.]
MKNHRLPHLPLWAWCYLLAAALWLVYSGAVLAFDTLCYATGRLRPQTVTLNDTALYTLEQLEYDGQSTLISTEGDPKLFLTPGQPVRTLRLVAQYSAEGQEKDLYYHLPGRGYTAALRVWPTLTGPDEYSYTVPFYAGQNLRLDLCDRSGVAITVQAIVLNEPQPIASYFVPSLWQLLWLTALPGLAACGLQLAAEAVSALRRKK